MKRQERYHSRDALSKALDNHRSWFAIVNEALATAYMRLARDSERIPNLAAATVSPALAALLDDLRPVLIQAPADVYDWPDTWANISATLSTYLAAIQPLD